MMERIKEFVFSQDFGKNKDRSEETPEDIAEINHNLELAADFLLSYNEEVEERLNGKNSFVIFVLNGKEKIGMSFFLLDDNKKVIQSLVGVVFKHTRKGIATKLLTKSHETLLKRGIKEYIGSYHDESLALVKKIVGSENVSQVISKFHDSMYLIKISN